MRLKLTCVLFLCTLSLSQPAFSQQTADTLGVAPLFAVKTNLLLDFAPYIPQYGWAPVPNVALEYYPRMSHWTVGASLDIPWWKNSGSHRYFQARNYQVEVRRYFRYGYTGWYLSAGVQGCLYGLGLNSKQGWQGEGAGVGAGAGYVLPLTRDKRLKLELSLQLGYFYTWYDPYVFGDPVNGEVNGLYYYNWTGDADDFRARQYRWGWFGPTRVGVTLSYDLILRKKEGQR